MNSILAFCENPKCGVIFEAPNFIGGNGSATIHMTDSKLGPCPACGSFGSIPDGVYEYANEAISFLTGPETSVKILREIQKLLNTAKNEPIEKEELLEQVSSISPDAAIALEKAPEVKNYGQWIGILIALVALSIQVHTSYFKSNDVEKEFREYLLKENQQLKMQLNKKKPYVREQPKIKRNDPCPCDSGKKYKKCCAVISI